MTEELHAKWREFGAKPIAMPALDFTTLQNEHGTVEHIKYAVPIGRHRARVLASLERHEQDLEMIVNTRYGVDALWKLLWRLVIRFLFKNRHHASSQITNPSPSKQPATS